MIGDSATDIMLRSSRVRHQIERLHHAFSCKVVTLGFTDGNVARRDLAAKAVSKVKENTRSFALSSTDHLDSSFKPTTPGSKILEHGDDIITNSLVVSGCGGQSTAVVYITSHSKYKTSCWNSGCVVR
jgi:hypothetical protein